MTRDERRKMLRETLMKHVGEELPPHEKAPAEAIVGAILDEAFDLIDAIHRIAGG